MGIHVFHSSESKGHFKKQEVLSRFILQTTMNQKITFSEAGIGLSSVDGIPKRHLGLDFCIVFLVIRLPDFAGIAVKSISLCAPKLGGSSLACG